MTSRLRSITLVGLKVNLFSFRGTIHIIFIQRSASKEKNLSNGRLPKIVRVLHIVDSLVTQILHRKKGWIKITAPLFPFSYSLSILKSYEELCEQWPHLKDEHLSVYV